VSLIGIPFFRPSIWSSVCRTTSYAFGPPFGTRPSDFAHISSDASHCWMVFRSDIMISCGPGGRSRSCSFHFSSIIFPASFRHCTLPAACSVEVDDHSPLAFSPLRSRRAGSHERR